MYPLSRDFQVSSTDVKEADRLRHKKLSLANLTFVKRS